MNKSLRVIQPSTAPSWRMVTIIHPVKTVASGGKTRKDTATDTWEGEGGSVIEITAKRLARIRWPIRYSDVFPARWVRLPPLSD